MIDQRRRNEGGGRGWKTCAPCLDLCKVLHLGKERLQEYGSVFQGAKDRELCVYHGQLWSLNHLGGENKLALGGFIFVLFFKLLQSSFYCLGTSEVPKGL